MGFIVLLLLSTVSIASSAAFFSVYGLAKIFSGSFWPVVIMASSLEAGKLVTASFTYRYWSRIALMMKIYLIAAILVLMSITSAGIFGFLSAAYQQNIMPIKLMGQKISLLETEKAELGKLKQERLARKQQIDNDIASLPHNYVTGRQRLMKSYQPELDQLTKDIMEYTNKIQDDTIKISQLKNDELKAQVHTGPIVFIAKVFGSAVDESTKWLILLLIFAFDPLAVILTIGVNMALIEWKRERDLQEKEAVIFEYENARHGAAEHHGPQPSEDEHRSPIAEQLTLNVGNR